MKRNTKSEHTTGYQHRPERGHSLAKLVGKACDVLAAKNHMPPALFNPSWKTKSAL